MDVKTILQLMAYQSINLDEVTDGDLPVYLSYLNLAYYEILREVSLKSPILPKIRETLSATNGVLSPPGVPLNSILSIRSIYSVINNKEFQKTNLGKILSFDPGLTRPASGAYALSWYFDSGNLNLYPIYSSTPSPNGPIPDIGIIYVATPPMLNSTSASADIYLPEIYHSVLVDGALYYLFQSESFKNDLKMKLAMDRWLKGKTDIAAYLVNLSGQEIYSTYRRF